MKKIGILTFHASHNIGSMLQSYALQTYLQETTDSDVEFIDYASPEQRNMYAIFPKTERKTFKRKLKGVARLVIDSVFYPLLKIRYDDFETFKNNYLILSENNYSYSNELDELENRYDYIFIGSDQIWNVNCRDFTDTYFVDFKTKAKLISYAPSLGGKNILKSDIDTNKVKSLLSNINSLSVREVNGKKWLDELTGKSFEVVCDPTLLLSKERWSRFLDEKKIKKKYTDYIFFYGQPFAKDTFEIIEKVSKKTNKKIVMLDAKAWLYNFCIKRGFILEKHCSPLDYLHLIKHASLVITTSYHGTIFSTVFEKDFWTVTFKGTNLDDDRVGTLLKQVGLEDRFIYIEDILDKDIESKVDYSNYDRTLEPLVSKSKNYIKTALTNSG
ncbi:polysaccharide pyruvyl transferase family protein [Salinivibrio kushneri]|uniref:polysaccharide pyruvyl transferase family protein n=1 Tax=Salinivibrio kushneri TaxID=1908198 RepID=UPI0022B4100E|nr:polysaccharide pyruvyl transferase family protein [Salinivibrio kushneri]WBA10882.1 polysaccharide pyruvyl transferase family protein [Salinivibrio kushneri]